MGVLGELGSFVLQSAARSIERQQKEREAQDFQTAMREFMAHEREIQAAAEKGDVECIQLLTGVYYRQGDYQQAAYWGRKGAMFDNEVCLYVMGEIAYAQEDYNSAANFFERNINAHGNITSATALGNMYLQAENFEQAAYYFDFVLRRDQSNGEAAIGLAGCLMNTEDPDLDSVEQLLQIATRSENQGTRDGARQALQQIRDLKAEQANQNNCFVTTAVCDSFGKPDDCYELTAFRKFRDGWLTAQPDGKSLIAEYYEIAPRIVAKINRLADAAQIYKTIWRKYLAPCLNFIERGDNLACKNKYVEMVRNLKKRYL